MNPSALLDVHPMLADRVRLAIMAKLAMADVPIDFNGLLNDLSLTKGNLSTHMRKLEDSGLIAIKKEIVGRKMRTTYQCTAKGKEEIRRYLSTIESVLKGVAD